MTTRIWNPTFPNLTRQEKYRLFNALIANGCPSTNIEVDVDHGEYCLTAYWSMDLKEIQDIIDQVNSL